MDHLNHHFWASYSQYVQYAKFCCTHQHKGQQRTTLPPQKVSFIAIAKGCTGGKYHALEQSVNGRPPEIPHPIAAAAPQHPGASNAAAELRKLELAHAEANHRRGSSSSRQQPATATAQACIFY